MEANKKAFAASLTAAALGAAALITVAGGANAAVVVDSPAVSQEVVTPAAGTAGTEAATETNDGTDIGPDMISTEVGHQDADDATESDSEDATEVDDGPDIGADMNSTEAGHQDADDATEADSDVESADASN
jgi:hypothetical protein